MPTRIIIIEDEFLIAADMEAVVNELGHEAVGVADDVESALALASDTVDIALVDVNLADGATGPLLGARLASDYAIEVIFVTANPAQLGDGVAGTIGALEKPLAVSVLSQTLDYVIDTRRGKHPAPPPSLQIFK